MIKVVLSASFLICWLFLCAVKMVRGIQFANDHPEMTGTQLRLYRVAHETWTDWIPLLFFILGGILLISSRYEQERKRSPHKDS